MPGSSIGERGCVALLVGKAGQVTKLVIIQSHADPFGAGQGGQQTALPT